MSSSDCPNKRIGVIGGGQLARMMAPPAQEMGLNLRILVEGLGTSAEQVFRDTVVGEISLDNLRRITYGLDGYEPQRTDVLTFEHEFVPNELIAQIEGEGFNVQPSSSALIYAQNKIKMRSLIDRLAVKHASIHNLKYALIKSEQDVMRFFDHNQFKEAVLKAPTGGYDGKGVAFISSSGESFVKEMLTNFDEVLIEEKVDFEFEVSAVVACSKNDRKPYPITQINSENGVCRTTITPAPKLSKKEQKTASTIALTIAKELKVQGILAVEMFYKAGKFYINELAMRPHNTGHWTIDGSYTSQFANHLRGVLDLPLGETAQIGGKYTVMQNILGSNLQNLTDVLPEVLQICAKLKVNLYGKDIRPGRKLGHINIIGDNLPELLVAAKQASDLFEGVAAAKESRPTPGNGDDLDDKKKGRI